MSSTSTSSHRRQQFESSLSSSSSSSVSYATYEAAKAREWNAMQADQIHWEREAAYRNQNYRHLYHQNGLIGTFQIRLLEAADLKRSYWSALAVGPVKLLGLSKAHGPVSSFVSFSLDTSDENCHYHHMESTHLDNNNNNNSPDAKPAAASTTSKPSASSSSVAPPFFVSPVIPHDDNPVWTNCYFHLPLRKGALQDGQPIKIQIRVDEDSTAVENLLPGVPSGGDSRLLGVGSLDITSLCLGQVVHTGQPQVGVLDAWVPLYLNKNNNNNNGQSNNNNNNNMPDSSSSSTAASAAASSPSSSYEDPLKKPSQENNNNSNNSMGRVRVLVSYQPNGMEPQPHDVVALEGFARQDARFATCQPVLPSRLPLHVLETSGSWLLVEYQLHTLHNSNSNLNKSSNNSNKARLKIHRNAVFVIERKNIIDETLNLALLPADVFMSTALGRSTTELVAPIFIAGKQLLMPALLSSKLIWMAVRTTALASLTGVQAATSAMWNEGSSSLTQEDDGGHHRRLQLQVQQQRPDGNFKFVAL